PKASSARIVVDYFGSGQFVSDTRLLHLWFLYYLLIFVVIVALLAPLFGRLTGTHPLLRIDDAYRWVIDSRWRVVIPALLTFPLMLPMFWIVDTPTKWNPQWHVVGYYFAFFGFGWMLFRHRDLVTAFGRWWGAQLIVANVLALPAVLGLIMMGAGEQ